MKLNNTCDLRKFVSKDPAKKNLSYVHVRDDGRIEATNGYVHIAVEPPHKADIPAGTLIDAAGLGKALKTKALVDVTTQDDRRIVAGDVIVGVADPGTIYPKTDEVQPEKNGHVTPRVVFFDPKKLADLCAYFAKHGGKAAIVKVEFFDETSPARITGTVGDQKTATAVIMPCRGVVK